MLDSRVRDQWEAFLRPMGGWLGRVPISPNVITILGVVVQGVVATLIVQGRLYAAGMVAIASGVADLLDGAVAKARKATTDFGSLLDSTTDRLTDALFFVPIAWLYGVSPDTPQRYEPWVAAVALVALVASFLVSYVKARAQSLGYDCNVGIAERAERFVLIVVALVLDVVPAAVTILAALSVVTFVQRMVHVGRQVVRAR